MSNILRKILKGSEDFLVKVISQLIDAIIWDLSIEYDIEVIKGER